MKTLKNGSDAKRVNFIRKNEMIESGIDERTASILAKSITRNTACAWYLESIVPSRVPMDIDKSKYSQLIDRTPFLSVNNGISVESGASRRTKLFINYGIVIKLDFGKFGHHRQGLCEWLLWDKANEAQRALLCPIAYYSQSNSGKVDDETIVNGTDDKTCRTGTYGITIMPYCTDVRTASPSEVKDLKFRLELVGLSSWDCKPANMGKYLGKWVLIDYGV